MSVYHCLVTTRPGGVPQLRALSCETDVDIPAAVAEVVREWSAVFGVEVFSDGQVVATYDADQVRTLTSRP
mgnify:CR=1 FL=1